MLSESSCLSEYTRIYRAVFTCVWNKVNSAPLACEDVPFKLMSGLKIGVSI